MAAEVSMAASATPPACRFSYPGMPLTSATTAIREKCMQYDMKSTWTRPFPPR